MSPWYVFAPHLRTYVCADVSDNHAKKQLPLSQVSQDAETSFDGFAYKCNCDDTKGEICSLCRVPCRVVATSGGCTTMNVGDVVFVKYHVSSRLHKHVLKTSLTCDIY